MIEDLDDGVPTHRVRERRELTRQVVFGHGREDSPNTNLAAATPQPLTRPPTLRLLTLHHLSAARHTPPHSSRLRPNASHYAEHRPAARAHSRGGLAQVAFDELARWQ